ncbi:MAG TPA: hypothetical protein PKA20_08505 [Burkholderiaceae bacterium]|nr:hypothetical protein [Burkholderiaceae bacterium]
MNRVCRLLRVPSLAFVTAAIVGCATPGVVRVDFVSDPPGAMIFSGSNRIGVAPVSLRVETPAEFATGGCTTAPAPLTASWISGAEAVINSRLCAAQGSHQVFTFRRPIAAGAQTDADHALKLKSDALFQQRGETMSTIGEPLAGWPPRPAPRAGK